MTSNLVLLYPRVAQKTKRSVALYLSTPETNLTCHHQVSGVLQCKHEIDCHHQS